jgi:hypothetical protein
MKLKFFAIVLTAISSSSASAANYHCNYSDHGQGYTLNIANDSDGNPTEITISSKTKHFTFSRKDISVVSTLGYGKVMTAQRDRSYFSFVYRPGKNPNTSGLKIYSNGDISSIGLQSAVEAGLDDEFTCESVQQGTSTDQRVGSTAPDKSFASPSDSAGVR